MKTLEQKLWCNVSRTDNLDDCWEWNKSFDTRGYGHFRHEGKNVRAHRVSWILANGRETEMYILHCCDNRKCVNPAHLFEGTHRDNMEDMAKKDRHSHSKFNLSQVARLRAMYQKHKGHLTQKRMADWFGVSKQTMCSLLKGGLRKFADGPIESEDQRFKLSRAQTEEVISRLFSGEKKISIARHFGVDRHVISGIFKRSKESV